MNTSKLPCPAKMDACPACIAFSDRRTSPLTKFELANITVNKLDWKIILVFPPTTELGTALSGRGLTANPSTESLRLGILKQSYILLYSSLRTVKVCVFIVCWQEVVCHCLQEFGFKLTIRPKAKIEVFLI